MEPSRPLRGIFRYWLPMFGTWMMMAVEAPFLAAVIARMEAPKENLAAFGVVYAVAILIESPVIMILSASTALVAGGESLRRLRRFTWALNGALTGIMLVVSSTPVWRFLARDVVALPEPVIDLSRVGLLLMTLWPAAIGYRRFHQGLLIRAGLTRRVAHGTLARLATMAAAALLLHHWLDLPGAWLGAAALGLGVLVEGVATRLMAAREVRRLAADTSESSPPGYRAIGAFYWPLALTSVVSLAVQPLVTFSVGRGRFPLESLAVLPVVNSLTFIFRSVGLSYQEVAIALLDRNRPGSRQVLRFGALLGVAATSVMALIAFTPLATLWFRDVSGLTVELTRFAIVPTRVLAVIPVFSVLLSLERAVLVHGRRTRPLTRATLLEVGAVAAALTLLISGLDLVGAIAAAIALVAGRIVGNLALLPPCREVLRRGDA